MVIQNPTFTDYQVADLSLAALRSKGVGIGSDDDR